MNENLTNGNNAKNSSIETATGENALFKATARLAKYCDENGFIYYQPNRDYLKEDGEYVYYYGDDETTVIWKYSIEDDSIIFPNDN